MPETAVVTERRIQPQQHVMFDIGIRILVDGDAGCGMRAEHQTVSFRYSLFSNERMHLVGDGEKSLSGGGQFQCVQHVPIVVCKSIAVNVGSLGIEFNDGTFGHIEIKFTSFWFPDHFGRECRFIEGEPRWKGPIGGKFPGFYLWQKGRGHAYLVTYLHSNRGNVDPFSVKPQVSMIDQLPCL